MRVDAGYSQVLIPQTDMGKRLSIIDQSEHMYICGRRRVVQFQRDFELDHICKQRDCMNPEHLELVTHQENYFRKSQLRVDMRSDYQNGLSIDEIAAKFGISRREDLIEQEEDSDASYMQRGLA